MSHTFHEDEQRNVHFEEWDRVLDDHLDTVHALQAGIDPALDWVWDDIEYLHPHVAAIHRYWDEFFRAAMAALESAIPAIKAAWEKIADAANAAFSWIGDLTTQAKEREISGPPPAPARVDRRHVTHTNTRPAKPAAIYRRRTP